MASIIRHGKAWRALVNRGGKRLSKVFPAKRDAQDWAARQEYLIQNGDKVADALSFGEVMDRYAREVSPGKRGARWEILRLGMIGRDLLARLRLGDMEARDFADYRDRRLAKVTPGTVRREMVLLSGVLTVARKEWGLITANPLEDVRKPASPAARQRLVTPDELARLALSAGDDLTTATGRALHAFRFGCETAMRAGEIVGLTWARVDLGAAVARLERTKNGTARDVPLSSEAIRLLEALPRADPVFGLRSAQLDALWRKIRDRAAVTDLHFHDSRGIAATMLARKLDVLDLARMTGHRDLNLLLRVYYRESASEIAKRLG